MKTGAIPARQPNGAARPLRDNEATRLLLQALGTLNRQADVHVLNTNIQGQPAALTIISGVNFAADENGQTILRKVNLRHEKR